MALMLSEMLSSEKPIQNYALLYQIRDAVHESTFRIHNQAKRERFMTFYDFSYIQMLLQTTAQPSNSSFSDEFMCNDDNNSCCHKFSDWNTSKLPFSKIRSIKRITFKIDK